MQCSAHVHILSVRTVRAVMLVGHKGDHQRLGRFASNEKRHIIWRTQSPKLCRGRPRHPFAKRCQAVLVGALRVEGEMTGAAKSRWNSPAAGHWWTSANCGFDDRQGCLPHIGRTCFHQICARPTCGCRMDPHPITLLETSGCCRGRWCVLRLGAGPVPPRIIAQQQCYCKRVPAGTGCTPSSPSHFGSMQHRPHAWIDC